MIEEEKKRFDDFVTCGGALCKYDFSKKCTNIGYITGIIQYINPPCFSCENYRI